MALHAKLTPFSKKSNVIKNGFIINKGDITDLKGILQKGDISLIWRVFCKSGMFPPSSLLVNSNIKLCLAVSYLVNSLTSDSWTYHSSEGYFAKGGNEDDLVEQGGW
jgi:hypothetical protein